MLRPNTLKTLALILLAYALSWLLVAFVPAYANSDVGFLLMIPLLSAYLLHTLGVPGILEHDGLCGWGLCSPTMFGWLFTAVVLLVVVWLVAWGISSLTSRLFKR